MWSQEAGAIIGKGGANINHLRKDVSMARAVLSHYWTVSSLCHDHANDRTQYKSTVTIPDCPGPERYCFPGPAPSHTSLLSVSCPSARDWTSCPTS